MAAATITTRVDVNDTTKEVVVLTFTDGETYVSRKFATVTGLQATLNEDTTTLTYPVSCAVSSATVTIHCEGVTDKKVCLTLYGTK
jgi:hypothetical protein